MKILVKSITLLCIYFCLLWLNSCIKCKDANAFYKMRNVLVSNSKITFPNIDSFVVNYNILNDTIHTNEYAITLDINYNKIAQASFPTFNTTWATKCVINFNIADSLTDIKIITLDEFDSLHKKGADVSNLFYYIKQNYQRPKLNYLSINEFLSNNKNGPINNITFYLKSQVESSRYIQFAVVLKSDNGNNLSDTTKRIFCKK